MRFIRWIRVLLQGGRCYRCKHYYKPFSCLDGGYCRRWHKRVRFDKDRCAGFEEMERNGK